MSKEFKLSDPGEGLQEAEISEVHVSEGDRVEDGDTVLTAETDKANTDVPAPFSAPSRRCTSRSATWLRSGTC